MSWMQSGAGAASGCTFGDLGDPVPQDVHMHDFAVGRKEGPYRGLLYVLGHLPYEELPGLGAFTLLVGH